MATARRSRTAPGEEREEEMEMQQQEEEEEEEEVCFHYPRGWARPGGTNPAVPRCPSSSELEPRPLERLSSGSERSRPRSRSRQRAAQPRYRDIQTLFAADTKSCSRRAAGDCDGARMTFTAQKCGVCFQPPSIILIYRDNIQEKTRQRIMPIRNFSRFSDCSRAAEEMKNNPRHKPYLEGVSLHQLEKLHRLLRDHLDGHSLSESLGRHHHEHTIDPEEDMNKLDDKELAKRKSIMDELFEKNRKRRDDPDFVYNVEVDFPQDEHLESCAWDEESDEEM